MPDNIIIRQSSESDLDAIIDLYQQTEMDNGKAVSKNKAAILFERCSTYPFYCFYVACNKSDVQKETIVGVFGLLIMDNIGHQGAPSAIIEGVCVDEEQQGQGIGKKMMQAAVDISRKHGCYKVALTSNIKREKAHGFYRSLGFIQHGLSFQLEI